MKRVRVILSPDAEEIYAYLNEHSHESKIEKSILFAFKKKVEFLKINCHYGNPVPKHLIPKEYVKKYGITNLYRVELPNYWRMLYTLTNGEAEIEIIAFVLDILDHPRYDKKFGYKKR